MTASLGALPRLALISDTTAERTGAGSLLMHRLLRDYPKDKLRIVYNPADTTIKPGVTLDGVSYAPLGYRFPRVVRNRLNPFWPVIAPALMVRRARRVEAELSGFDAQAVVSVANAFLWFTADAYATRRGIPLYLFLHEEWAAHITLGSTGPLADLVRSAARARVAPVLRRAAGRFSVSPGMAESLSRKFGLGSVVLYPNRGEDSPEPRVRVRATRSGGPVVAHAGFVHLPGNAALLRDVARVVGERGGHLDLYTMHTEAELAQRGLVGPVVRRVGYFPAREMAERVASTADALILTASFEEKDRVHESTLFPSKLADYTGIGLPIVTWGPSYSSAARWVASNPGAAVLVTERDVERVRSAIDRLVSDPEHATSIARGGIEAGRRDFDLNVARDAFYAALLDARPRAAKSGPASA